MVIMEAHRRKKEGLQQQRTLGKRVVETVGQVKESPENHPSRHIELVLHTASPWHESTANEALG